MKWLGMLGGGAFTVVSYAVGLRLLALSWRTRQLPELLIGASMLLLAGVGYPLSAVARESAGLPDGLRAALGALAGAAGAIGLTSNTAFTFVLFRRHERWARALLALVAIFSVALFAGQSRVGDWTHGDLFWGGLPFGITLSYGWGFVECGRYHRMLRRRLRIGLADPVVTDRFGLYTAATGLAMLTNTVGQVYWWLGLEMLTDRTGALLLVLIGSSSSVLMWLAFLPPRAYIARVRARATTA